MSEELTRREQDPQVGQAAEKGLAERGQRGGVEVLGIVQNQQGGAVVQEPAEGIEGRWCGREREL